MWLPEYCAVIVPRYLQKIVGYPPAMDTKPPATAPSPATPSVKPPVSAALPTLRKGSKGDAVKTLQTALNKAGTSSKLTVDGDFGAKSETAVKAFQKAKKLTQDGVVGAATWKALGL